MLPKEQTAFQASNAHTGCDNVLYQSVDPKDTWYLCHDEQLIIIDTKTETKIDFTELSRGICTDNYSFRLERSFT
jgi:hypothetical protein